MRGKIEEIIKIFQDNEERDLIDSKNPQKIQKYVRVGFLGANERFAAHAVKYKEYAQARQYFYNYGLVREYLSNEYDDVAWFYFDTYGTFYVFLSDHKELIERYINYPQPDNGHEKYHVHHNFLIQAIFKNDEEQANYWLNLFKEDSVRIRPHEKLAESYYHLYNGLLKKDNDQFLEGLNVLNSTKQRKKRIREELEEECYSRTILGYLKLAKYRGLVIENSYEDVPDELLETSPLPEYKVPYWFLESKPPRKKLFGWF